MQNACYEVFGPFEELVKYSYSRTRVRKIFLVLLAIASGCKGTKSALHRAYLSISPPVHQVQPQETVPRGVPASH